MCRFLGIDLLLSTPWLGVTEVCGAALPTLLAWALDTAACWTCLRPGRIAEDTPGALSFAPRQKFIQRKYSAAVFRFGNGACSAGCRRSELRQSADAAPVWEA